MNLSKILIIRLSSIGDIILASPLIRCIRAKYPDSQIDFLVRKDYSELVSYNKNLSNVIEFDIKSGSRGLNELASNINKAGYDVILDIHNCLRSRYIRKNSSAKKFIINKNIIRRFLLVNFKINIYNNYISVIDRYINTASSLSVNNDGRGPEVFLPEAINHRITDTINYLNLPDHSVLIGAAPSAKHFTKKWPRDNYAKLFSSLIKNLNAVIINLGGKEDKDYIDEIVENVNSGLTEKKCLNVAGKLTLLETAAAIDRCSLLITNDTGLMHLAAARKRKIAAVFGPTVKEFGFFPYGVEVAIIENNNLNCRPCSHIGSSECPKKHFKCMKEISVDGVFLNIKTLLKN